MVGHELRLLTRDPLPIMILVVFPLMLMSFLKPTFALALDRARLPGRERRRAGRARRSRRERLLHRRHDELRVLRRIRLEHVGPPARQQRHVARDHHRQGAAVARGVDRTVPRHPRARRPALPAPQPRAVPRARPAHRRLRNLSRDVGRHDHGAVPHHPAGQRRRDGRARPVRRARRRARPDRGDSRVGSRASRPRHPPTGSCAASAR